MSWEAGGYSQQFPFPVIQTERGKISGHFFFPWAIALSEQAVAFPKSLLERNGKNISVKYHYKVVQPWIGTDAFASLCPEEKLQVFLLTSHFPGHFQSCFPLRPWRVRSWVSKLSTARLSLEENMKNVIQMVNCKQKKRGKTFKNLIFLSEQSELTWIGHLQHEFLFCVYLVEAPCQGWQVRAVSEDAAIPTAAVRVG